MYSYWDIRGLAQAIRFALEFAGAPYADFRIDAGAPPPNPHYKESWTSVKDDVGMILLRHVCPGCIRVEAGNK